MSDFTWPMFKAMKDSVLGCLFGGFTAHSQCGQEVTVVRDRSPHQRQPAAAMNWNVGQERSRRGPTKKPVRGTGPRQLESVPLTTHTPPKQRPQYLLDLKSDTPYLEETDLGVNRSRAHGSEVGRHHHPHQPQLHKIEADVHQSYHGNHHYDDDLPVRRGILKKTQPTPTIKSPGSVSRGDANSVNVGSPDSPIYLSLQSRAGGAGTSQVEATPPDKPARLGELSQESVDFLNFLLREFRKEVICIIML